MKQIILSAITLLSFAVAGKAQQDLAFQDNSASCAPISVTAYAVNTAGKVVGQTITFGPFAIGDNFLYTFYSNPTDPNLTGIWVSDPATVCGCSWTWGRMDLSSGTNSYSAPASYVGDGFIHGWNLPGTACSPSSEIDPFDVQSTAVSGNFFLTTHTTVATCPACVP